MKSIVYWHPFIYSLFIKFSFKRNYTDRYRAIADIIPKNSSIIDVCCGDCRLYNFLKSRYVDYLGLDFNKNFIMEAKKKGIKGTLFNIYIDEIPRTDYVIMQGSLYQFIPNHAWVLNKLYDAAGKCLIISEPVKNYASSRSRFVSLIAKMLNNPGDGIKVNRFNISTLKEAMRPYERNIVKEFYITSGIEYVVVVKKA